jgi:hypothetical protein
MRLIFLPLTVLSVFLSAAKHDRYRDDQPLKEEGYTTDLTAKEASRLTCAAPFGAKLPDTAGEDSVSILPALLGTAKAPLREALAHHSIFGVFAKTVSFENTKRFTRLMKEAGNDCVLVPFPGKDHGFFQ